MPNDFPAYHLDRRRFMGLVASALFKQRRSFSQDSKQHLRGVSHFEMHGSPPQPGRFKHGSIVTFNHYWRPGFNSWWMGFALAAAIPDLKLVITSSFTYPDDWMGRQKDREWRFILGRVIQTYDFIGMPAIPPRPNELADRSNAIRRIVTYLRSAPNPCLGFAPEGRDSPDGMLNMPYPGVGRLLAYLTNSFKLAVQPAGIYEEHGSLILNFGNPYYLDAPQLESTEETDKFVSRKVMQAIAACLPVNLWDDGIQPLVVSHEKLVE